MHDLASVPFARQQRWRFFEAALIWEGSINRARIARTFDVAINHVTKDIAAYEVMFPKNIQYNNRKKVYTAGSRFKPALASGDPAEYLSLMQAYAETASAVMRPAVEPGLVDAAVVPQPGKSVDRRTLCQVVQAIRRKEALDMTYSTLTAETNVQRTVWPHAIAFDGKRWHIRAYDQKRGEFRDFALRRITSCQTRPVDAPVDAGEDVKWNRTVTAEVVPNPSLAKHRQSVIAADFGMHPEGSGWIWRHAIRMAMLPYFARFYGLDVGPDARPKPRVILRNLDELRRLLFPTDMD